MEVFGFPWRSFTGRSMKKHGSSEANEDLLRWLKTPVGWWRSLVGPRGCWPFKRSGRGRGASWLRCFCLSVSERSWAEAAERVSRGQVRAANKLPFLLLWNCLCVSLSGCVFKALQTSRLLVSVTSFVKRRSCPFPPVLSLRSNGSFILQNLQLYSYYYPLFGLIRAYNFTLAFIYLVEDCFSWSRGRSSGACLFVQSIIGGSRCTRSAFNEKSRQYRNNNNNISIWTKSESVKLKCGFTATL